MHLAVGFGRERRPPGGEKGRAAQPNAQATRRGARARRFRSATNSLVLGLVWCSWAYVLATTLDTSATAPATTEEVPESPETVPVWTGGGINGSVDVPCPVG